MSLTVLQAESDDEAETLFLTAAAFVTCRGPGSVSTGVAGSSLPFPPDTAGLTYPRDINTSLSCSWHNWVGERLLYCFSVIDENFLKQV